MTNASRHIQRRRRAIERLRTLTTGAAVAGVAGTAGFGILAAVSWSGDPTASSAADLSAGSGSASTAPDEIFGSTPNSGSTSGSPRQGDARSAGPARERPEPRDDRRLPLMSLPTTKARRLPIGSPVRRPAVVEHVDLPQSTSDGRAAILERRGFGAQARSFVAIGVVSTVAWAVLYAVLRAWMSPVSANGIALVVSAIGNTAANRRFTFGVRGRDRLVRDHGAGLIAFAVALALTTGAASLLPVLAPRAGRLTEVAVLVVANAAATVARFVLLRAWVGRRELAA